MPQGSIIGRILFVLYINDVVPSTPTLQSFTFADDTKLAKEVTKIDYCLELQKGLASITYWSTTWNLTFNVNKCNLMQFSTPTALILTTS